MAKKRLLLVGPIILIIVLSFIMGIITGNNNKKLLVAQAKEEEKQKITFTQKNFAFFSKNEIIENENDASKTFLNKVLIEQEKNKNINPKAFLQKNISLANISDNQKLVEAINQEKEEYRLDLLDIVNIETFRKTINDKNIDKKTLEEIFTNHNFVKEIDQEKAKRKEYLEYLNNLEKDFKEIASYQKDFFINNGTYMCYSNEMVDILTTFNKKYNLNLKIERYLTLKERPGIPILCYHGILDIPWGYSSLFVKPSEFAKQMAYLKEEGYTPIFVSEIANAKNYEKPIIITFDDGYKDVYTNAYPILQKYEIKANVYMISDWIDGDVYMTWDMTKEMSESPLIEIGSHTASHPKLATLADEQIELELAKSKETLEEKLDVPINVLAYPSGSYNRRVINIAKKYYNYALSTNEGKEDINNINTYTLNRIYVYRSYNMNTFKSLF